jgi:hypothetical protein
MYLNLKHILSFFTTWCVFLVGLISFKLYYQIKTPQSIIRAVLILMISSSLVGNIIVYQYSNQLTKK